MIRDEQSACRVLVLDDKPFMRKQPNRMLDRLGFTQVVAMESAAQGLLQCARFETEPRRVLLGLNMPEMDGIEFLRKLGKKAFDGAVILVSGSEDHGLIDALTLAVFHKALTDMKAWRELCFALCVDVNVSMDNLDSLDFPNRLVKLADDAGVAPNDLTLEVTESLLLQDLRAVLEVLGRLRLQRFDLAIDEFGSGHSSLAQLRDLPFTQLKIDKGSVRCADADSSKKSICIGSVDIAKRLGMEIVAEGVETQVDQDFLKRTDCDIVQGYYIVKPIPADALSDRTGDGKQRFSSPLECSTVSAQVRCQPQVTQRSPTPDD